MSIRSAVNADVRVAARKKEIIFYFMAFLHFSITHTIAITTAVMAKKQIVVVAAVCVFSK